MKQINLHMTERLWKWIKKRAKETHPRGEGGNVTQYLLSLVRADKEKKG